MNSVYRSEIKYEIDENVFNLLNYNLNTFLRKDEYCDDYYTISSIYFDNFNKESYKQVTNGISRRWKYRIRYYNHNDKCIKLEKKFKLNGYTKKDSINITKKELDGILNNKLKVNKKNQPLLNEVILKMQTELLRPIIYIEYERIPYVYKLGNVRITLDYNIRYSKRFDDLFDKNKNFYYINNRILEVKYSEFIPEFILERINVTRLNQTSFSKFKTCIDDYDRRYLL